MSGSQVGRNSRNRSYNSYSPSQQTLAALLLGALLGLILGLVIGWGLWPVEWTNAQPADLAPNAKAEYIAAVADSYTAARTAEALALANARLAPLGADVGAEIMAAQRYFADSGRPDTVIRSNNLAELTVALGLVAAAAEPPAANEVQPEAAPTFDANSGSTTEAEDFTSDGTFEPVQQPSRVRSWLGSLAWIVAALALIGGGLALLRWVLRMYARDGSEDRLSRAEREYYRAAADEESDQFSDEDYSGATLAPSKRSAAQPAAGAQPVTDADNDYLFDQEDWGRSAIDPSAEAVADFDPPFPAPETQRRSPSGAVDAPPDRDRREPSTAAPAAPTFVEAPDEESSEPVWRDLEVDDFPPAVVREESVAFTPAPQRAVSHSRPLGEFSARYQLGVVDYEESFNIQPTDSDGYIGECGMGMNMKNGLLQNNAEHVIALDVWLFDKADQHHLETKTRVLISKYVENENLEELFSAGGDVSEEALLAQPGTEFQIETRSLVMECKVVGASFSEHEQNRGIFRDVQLEMTVRARP